MKIEYVSAVFDGSGYGAAARNYIHALRHVGQDVIIRPVSFEQRRPDLGAEGDLFQSLVREEPADIRILHVTPDLFGALVKDRPPILTIGYATWEADKLPPGWADQINAHCSQLWVPSAQNVRAFLDSGVTIPVHRVPHCFRDPGIGQEARVLPETTAFRFLSVFQWHERKHPLGLLKAYFTAFQSGENVSLVLKTYLTDSSPSDREQIKAFINETKRMLYLPTYPKIELVVKTLSAAEITRLYHDCHCYVSLHRNEGFGIPVAEAVLAGLPVIVSDYGGTKDFVDASMGHLIPCQETPVFGMPWPTYTGAMTWAEPDLMAAQRAMRSAARGGIENTGRAKLLANLSYGTVGRRMVELLQ